MMTKEEKETIQQYHKAHQATEELLTAIQNNGSLADCETFNDLTKSNPYAKELINRLMSKEQHEEFANTRNSQKREEDIKKFYKTLEKETLKKRSRKLKLTILSISSCAALLLCSFLIWTREAPTLTPIKIVIANQISHEVTEPTIIMDNGESIPLSQLEKQSEHGAFAVEKTGNLKVNYQLSKDSVIKYNTLIMPAKNKRTIVLGDGTEVCLNSGSKLVYPIGIHSDMREVTLEGEAFFKVTKSDKPFIVRMGTSTIKVYGTMFNLRNLKGEIETVLVEGKVGFTTDNQQEILMVPNQKLNYNIKNKQSSIEKINADDYIMWMNDFFSFKSQTLERVLNDISSWYGITITTRSELMVKELTLVQKRDDTPKDILNFIAEILNVKLVVQGKEEYSIE